MNKTYHYFVFLIVGLFLCTAYAFAATVWTQVEGQYFKYDITPSNTTDSSFKYVSTTNLEVNATWLKMDGVWLKYTSAAGSVKYVLQPPAPPAICDAFVCNGDFGWVFNMQKNTVLACPYVKISAGQALIYDGIKSINGVPTCPAD